MAELPSGTVTFLFTDIEGSTTRWEHQPEAMGTALARHDVLLRAAIREHDGHVVKTMGDAFHAVFVRAPDAVAAALDAQRGLQAEPWGEIGPIPRTDGGAHRRGPSLRAGWLKGGGESDDGTDADQRLRSVRRRVRGLRGDA
jgi:class 3 adenylate cyclase